MRVLTEKGKIVIEALQKFKDRGYSKRAISKWLFDTYPQQFDTFEQAYGLVRAHTGTNGKYTRERGQYIYDLGKLPEPHIIKWEPHVITGHKKILRLTDIHFPYHDARALDLAINYGIKKGATLVQLGGDTMDMYHISDFDKNPTMPSLAVEFQMAADFVKLMRATFGSILWSNGNHSERWEHWLMRHPQFMDMDELKLNVRLDLDDDEYVTDKRIIKAGKLSLIHGHEVGRGIYSPVNFARTLINKTGTSTAAGHVHYLSSHPFKRLDGDEIMCWSQGCLCQLNPPYMPINQWSHGFSFIELQDNGDFHFDNKKILNGKIL